jgi:hypothetical protein
MVSCVTYLLKSSRDAWPQLSCSEMYLLFRLGLEIRSPLLEDIFEVWLDQPKEAVTPFIDALLGSKSLWKSNSFTKFEAKPIRGLAIHSKDLTKKYIRKLSTCKVDMTSIEAVLSLRKTLVEEQSDLLKASTAFLTRSMPTIESMVINEDRTETDWDIFADFISHSEDIDLEKWLGVVCKHDENLIPEGSLAIKAILDRDATIFHRTLPGWIVRTFSRFTRRFAEDKMLSEAVLTAVDGLSISPAMTLTL